MTVIVMFEYLPCLEGIKTLSLQRLKRRWFEYLPCLEGIKTITVSLLSQLILV